MSTDEELINRNAELTKANAEAIRMFREDMASNEEKRESKLNGMAGILNNVVKVPDEDVIGVTDAAVVAKQVKEKTEQVAVLQASLDVATVELVELQKVVTAPATEELAMATINKALPVGG